MARRGCGERRRAQSGAVAVEFAIVFIVFAMVLWGLITYGVIFALQQTMTHAAGESVRASVGLSDADAISNAEDIVESQLAWIGGFRSHVTTDVQLVSCDYDPAHTCLTTRITFPWRAQPIVPSLLGIATPRELTASATLQRTQ